MAKKEEIPFSRMEMLSESGVFIKRFGHPGRNPMKPYVHRDEYYIIALLTNGSASVEIDFERKRIKNGEILIVSPWQVHSKPKNEAWDADGWMMAFSPELLSEQEAWILEEYAISPTPFNPGKEMFDDIVSLLMMLDRNKDNKDMAVALANCIKSVVLSSLSASNTDASGRYKNITLKLRRLLDEHLCTEKSPAAYASMLNISEIYLNEAIKGATGLSAGAYIRNRAIIQARRKLSYTSLSSKEIAYDLGYEDYAYFSKLFKKCVGVSPSEYRRNLK